MSVRAPSSAFRRLRAALAKPGGHRAPPSVDRPRGVKWRLLAVLGHRVDVCAATEEEFGHPALTAVARLVEGPVDVLAGRWRVGGQELLGARDHAQGGRMPQAVNPRAPVDEKASDVPTAVAEDRKSVV